MAKKMNPYFEKMVEAKKKDAPSFTYNGKTYVRTKLKSGISSYKKK